MSPASLCSYSEFRVVSSWLVADGKLLWSGKPCYVLSYSTAGVGNLRPASRIRLADFNQPAKHTKKRENTLQIPFFIFKPRTHFSGQNGTTINYIFRSAYGQGVLIRREINERFQPLLYMVAHLFLAVIMIATKSLKIFVGNNKTQFSRQTHIIKDQFCQCELHPVLYIQFYIGCTYLLSFEGWCLQRFWRPLLLVLPHYACTHGSLIPLQTTCAYEHMQSDPG